MVHLCCFTVPMIFMIGGSADAADATRASNMVAAHRILVIAHRGDSKQAPENTLPAFVSAVEAGANLIELDYYHSADGVPVVFHDKTLDRTTDAVQVYGGAKIPIAGKTLAELQRLDAGSWFHPKYAKTQIPTLEQALDAIQQNSTTLIEHKAGDAATCIRLLKKKKLLHDVVVQSFDWQFVADCHRLAPDLVLAALGGDDLTEDRLNELKHTGARIVGWNHKHIAKPQVNTIHERGMKVWVYTVNDASRARELIRDGIDGIITDVPATMLELVSTSAAGKR